MVLDVKNISKSLTVLGLSTLLILTSCGQPANLPATNAVAILSNYQVSSEDKAAAVEKAKSFVVTERRNLEAQGISTSSVSDADSSTINFSNLNWSRAEVIPQQLYGEGTEVVSVPTTGGEMSGQNRLYVITTGELAGEMAKVNVRKDPTTGNIITTVIDLETGEREVWHRNPNDATIVFHEKYNPQGLATLSTPVFASEKLSSQAVNCGQLKSTRDSEKRALRNALLGAGAGYIAVIVLICALAFLSAGLSALGMFAFLPEVVQAGNNYTRARNDYSIFCNGGR